ncbi:MAG: hypothetical protein JNM94_15375 [Phycisphaerae bacterium]|nr:hypothetical protein [Phycisphaerae bacterium]
MHRSLLPVLLALPMSAIVSSAMAAGTLTATSDNRSGSILASNGSGDPVQSGYNIDPSEIFDPKAFNECANASPAKACLNTSSAFIGLTGGNVVTGFSIDSVLTATKSSSSSQLAISDEDVLVGFKVAGASAGSPYKLRLQGARNGTLGSFSLKFKTAGGSVLFNGPASGVFDITLDLQNGDYLLEIAANLTANGTSTGGSFDYSVDVTTVVPPPGCGQPGSGSCTVAKGTPFCDDAACCTLVCSFDPFCCTNSWDQLCANEATAGCYPQAVAGPMIDPKTGRKHRLYSSGAWTLSNALAAQAGENLVTIRTARENEWIRRNLLNNVPGIPAAEAWIGLNDQVVEGAFAWDSGAPATFFTWAPGEPNNLGNEDFAALNHVSGRWNDLGIGQGRRAVTEIGFASCGSGGSPFETHGPGSDDESCCNLICEFDSFCCLNSWDQLCVNEATQYCSAALLAGPYINPKNKHKYWVTTDATWTRAQRLAMDVGGYLAIPNNAAENEWIRQNLANAAVGPTQFWIGVHDQLVENQFQTVEGPLAAFTQWNPGEPNNAGGNEDFTVMTNPATGNWNDTPNLLDLRGVIEVPCKGDLNDDGKVDGSDLGVLLGAWASGLVDLTFDGATDGADLAVILGAWGPCATSNCCSSHSGTGCDQPACTSCVCALDPFCCQTQWDSICANESADECNAACQCGA